MVFIAFTYTKKFPLIFIEAGVKVNKEIYREKVSPRQILTRLIWKQFLLQLLEVLVPQIKEHFGGRSWTFQQDGAPSHRADETQDWLAENTPDFIQVLSKKNPRNPKYADQ